MENFSVVSKSWNNKVQNLPVKREVAYYILWHVAIFHHIRNKKLGGHPYITIFGEL